MRNFLKASFISSVPAEAPQRRLPLWPEDSAVLIFDSFGAGMLGYVGLCAAWCGLQVISLNHCALLILVPVK